MKRILSLVIVASMLLSLVAVVPMNASAAEDKKSTDVEAYYFGGEAIFCDHEGAATTLKVVNEISIKDKYDASKGTVVLDGKIDEGEWGSPAVFVDSNYAASNDGLTGRTNPAYEEASAENTYFYYKKDSYLTPSGSYYPWEKGMNYSLYFMWDEEYLYIAADVYDASGHASDAANKDAWDADTFQFRVDKDGPNGIDEGYNADGGLDADGNKIVNMPWRSSVYASGGEITSEVPNFIVTRTSADGGYTLVRDNANRYFPHEEDVASADNPDVLVKETRYADTELSYFLESYEYPIVETYEDFKANNLRARIPEFMEYGAVYATARAHKIEKKVMQTQYEIAVPWEYIDDADDFMAQVGKEFGISTMVVDRQNSKSGTFGAFLEWGSGINASHRPNYDPATCSGSNKLTLSDVAYDEHVACDHDFEAATCVAPETCAKCGYQRGFKTGHDYELVNYKLPTTKASGYANATCLTCGEMFNRNLAQASDTVHKSFNRNGGLVDLSKSLSSAFAAVWTQMKWTKNADGNWENEAGANVYNVDGENSGKTKDMLWLAGQVRPEITSSNHTDATGIKNPYDFAVLDMTCFSETASYFHLYDFSSKNSTVTMQLDIWNRLEGTDREMEGESGYHDTVAFWFGPNAIDYLAGLFIVEDKDADGNVTDTKYYFAITPQNSSQLTIAEFEETAMAYVEIDPSVLNIGQGSWDEMTFFVDYDANVALLFWNGELVVGEYDPHFTTTKSTVDPILRVFNIEMCVTDFYAGQAGLAAEYVTLQGGEGADTEPTPDDTSESETEAPAPALGSYENPYILEMGAMMPLKVTVAPGEAAYVKANASEGTVTAGYATSADYMIFYGRQSVMPAGADNAASFDLMMGNDIFQICNTSETDSVMVALALEEPAAPVIGTIDNPEVLTVVEGEATMAEAQLAANNQGYFYEFTAPVDGEIEIQINSDGGWMYVVNNLTTYAYGDTRWSDDAEVVNPATITVTAGDVIQVIVGTYDPANAWSAPAGTVGVEISYVDNTPVLGSYENPFILEVGAMMPLRVTVAPGETAFVKTSVKEGTVTAGYATSADYMIYYGRQSVAPAGEDNAAFFNLMMGNDVFQVYNTSETDSVTVMFALEAGVADSEEGTVDNPEVIDLVSDSFGTIGLDKYIELGEANEGYYMTFVAPASGKLFFRVDAYDADFEALGWRYFVNNLTTGEYGDIVVYDLDPDVILDATSIEVNAGDEIVVFVATYDPNNMWSAPAGTANLTISFAGVGAHENPEVIEPGQHTVNIDQGSWGYYYEYAVTEDGKITVEMNTESNWQYQVIVLPADEDNWSGYYYGDTHWYDDEFVVTSETVDVKAGDTVKVMVCTYDAETPWTAPAGTIDWTLSFAVKEVFNGDGLLYTLNGAVIDDQLIVTIDISDNNEGIFYAGLDFVYNTEALTFVSAETYNEVFDVIEYSNLVDLNKLQLLAYMNGSDNSYTDGKMITVVFDINDDTADYGLDLVLSNGDAANHINIDSSFIEYEVKFTFEMGEITPPVIPMADINVSGEAIDNQLHVYVDIDNNPGIWALGFSVNYNSAVLELVDTIYGDVFGEGEYLDSVDALGFNFYGNNEDSVKENITENGRIVELVFNVLDYSVEAYEYGIDFYYDFGNVINANGKDVILNVTVEEIEKVEEPVYTLNLGVTGEAIDDQLHVYVDVTNNPGIWSLGFTVEYNFAALQIVDIIYGDVFGEGEVISNASIFFGNNSSVEENNTATGRVVELVFDVVDYDADYGIDLTYIPGNVIDNAGNEVDVVVEIGEIERLEKPAPTTAIITVNGVETEYEIGATVKLHAPKIYKDADGNHHIFKKWTAEGLDFVEATELDVEFVVTGDATLTVVRYLHGDIDGNGKVNQVDYARFKQHLLGKNDNINMDAANVDLGANGNVNQVDYASLKKIMLNTFNYDKFEVAEVEFEVLD